MQNVIRKLKLPRSIGRMQNKLSTMSGFTAAELKTFTTVLSSALFEDVEMSTQSLNVWNHFVAATRHLTKAMVTDKDLLVGQSNLHMFAKGFESLYTPSTMKPNLHYAFHILDCILDYGPVYVFQVISPKFCITKD